MSKFKRCVSVFLMLVLMGALLIGCDKKNGENNENTTSNATITWYMPGDKQTDMQTVMDEANKIITPKIGAKLDLQFIDGGSFQEKMTMMIASSKEFDLCFTSDWANKFLPNANNGAYLPLNDLMKKYTPNFKKALPDYLWNASTVKGDIYAVPNLQVMFYQTSLIIFKNLADKYGLDASKIKKVEDLEPFFEQVKKNEKNIYAYRAKYGTAMFTSPVYEDVQPNTGVAIKKDGSDHKLVSLYKTDEYKHGIKVIRRLFEKGYIRPDAASVMNDDQDLAAGKYAVFQGIYKPGGDGDFIAKYKQESVTIPIEEAYLKANAGMSTMTAISRTSKNKDKAIRLLELVNTDKTLYNILSFGVEGKHYKKVNDQQIDIIPDSGYLANSTWKIGNQFNAFYLKTQKPGIWEETDKINNTAKKSPLAGFVLNIEPIKTELSQCNTVMKEFEVLNTGSDDPDKIYDSFLTKLNDAGHQKVIDEIQKQVDEWFASKK